MKYSKNFVRNNKKIPQIIETKHGFIPSIDRYWMWWFWGVFTLVATISLWGLWGDIPRLAHDNNYPLWLSLFDELIKSKQFLPGWTKEFYFGYGGPLFIFYPPLFFYLAEIPRLLGTSLVVAVKLATGVSFLMAFFSMYWLGKELWGKFGGLLSALFYLTAPYHFALIYTRGALAENLAYAWFPLVILFIYRLFMRTGNQYWNTIGLALSSTAIILTNIPAALVLLSAGGAFVLVLIIWKRTIPAGFWLGILGGGLLSAFYVVPFLTNLHLINTEYFLQFQYGLARYSVTLIQYLPWRIWQAFEYYQVGWVGLIIFLISIVVVIMGIVRWFSTRQSQKHVIIVGGLLGLLCFGVFLASPASHGLWEQLLFVRYIQFPFRFLLWTSLCLAILTGYLAYYKRALWWQILLLLLVQAILFSRPVYNFQNNIYKEDQTYTVYSNLKAQLLSNENQSSDTVSWWYSNDPGYLPKPITRNQFTQTIWPGVSDNINGLSSITEAAHYSLEDPLVTTAQLDNIVDSTNGISFDYKSDEPNWLIYQQFGFPGWQVMIDHQLVEWTNWIGLIQFPLAVGEHHVDIRYVAPPGAIMGRSISLISWLILLGFTIQLFIKRIVHPSR